MSAKQRRRRRRIEFVVSWTLVITVLLLLIGLLIFFLKSNAIEEQEEIVTVGIYNTTQSEQTTEAYAAEPPKVTVEVKVQVRMADPVPIDAEETYISDEIQRLCVEIGNKNNICPELLMALIEQESSGRIYAESGECKGLCQVSEKWHHDRMGRLGVTNIFDERGNIAVAADYLVELFEKYEDPGLVLMIYNGTSDAIEMARKGELTYYAKSILERSAELERLHGK